MSDNALDHIWLPYTQMRHAAPLRALRTEGCRIQLDDGRWLIDGIASWWTACHGYNHPAIAAALRDQIALMPHVMFAGLVHEPALRLADRLAALLPAPLSRVFFAESGSIAVEIAMKMAVQGWINRGQSRRTKVLSFHGGYHGDSFATMAVSDPLGAMHARFQGVLPSYPCAPLPDGPDSIAAFERVLDRDGDDLAAMLVEPLVQGAGGMKFHGAEVLRCLREACDRTGALLIFDEIFTGFGRTGAMFAMDSAGVVPDIVTLSKALTGGTLPMSAVVASEAVFDRFLSDDPADALMHGPTYMANPLACAAAHASLDLFASEDRLGQAAAIERLMLDGLAPCRDLPGVVDVRAMGAIGVVQLAQVDDVAALRSAFVEQGVWIRPFRDIVYLTPALTITKDALATLCAAIVHVLSKRTR